MNLRQFWFSTFNWFSRFGSLGLLAPSPTRLRSEAFNPEFAKELKVCFQLLV